MNKAGRAEDAYIQLQDAAVQGRTYINRDGLDQIDFKQSS